MTNLIATDQTAVSEFLGPLLAEITEKVKLKVSDVSAMLVGGSYGRGEGILVHEGGRYHPANDIDVIIIRNNWSFRDRALLRAVASELCKITGLRHLDLIPMSASQLTVEPLTMLIYDLQRGALCIYGENPLAGKVPSECVPPFPLEEIRNLLINRMVTLLEGHPAVRNSLDAAHKARQIAKALFAVFDATLYEAGGYQVSYKAKASGVRGINRIGQISDWASRALTFSLTGDELDSGQLLTIWNVARIELLKALVSISAARDGKRYEKVSDTFTSWRGKSALGALVPAVIAVSKGRKIRRIVETEIASHLDGYRDSNEWRDMSERHIARWYAS